MKLLDFILCDSIRQEVSNKLTLVGIYNDQLVIQIKKDQPFNWPAAINLFAYIRFLPQSSDPEFNSFSFALDNGTENVSIAKGEVSLEGNKPFIINLQFALPIKGPGPILAKIKFLRNDTPVIELEPEIPITVIVQ